MNDEVPEIQGKVTIGVGIRIYIGVDAHERNCTAMLC